MNRVIEQPPLDPPSADHAPRPAAAVHSLLAGGRATEVRLQDLRFTRPEIREFLAAAAELEVGEEALANLLRQIEGWAVGLRLVSLALRHAADPDAFLSGLEGGVPQTQEYLLQEVLAAQSPEVRGCLLRSSILDRFSPDSSRRCAHRIWGRATGSRGPGVRGAAAAGQRLHHSARRPGRLVPLSPPVPGAPSAAVAPDMSSEEIASLHIRAASGSRPRT